MIRRLTMSGIVETIVGRRRFDGNYGVAWEQILNGPAGVVWDPKGGYYIYEQNGAHSPGRSQTAPCIQSPVLENMV